LVVNARILLRAGLAESTHAQYSIGTRRYEEFARLNGIIPYPSSESVLCLFVAHLCMPTITTQRPVSSATARIYITGVAHTHSCMGLTLQTSSFRLLKQSLTGAERSGITSSRPTRIPITVTDVQSAANHVPRNYNGVLCLAAMYVAACGLLRISELLGQVGKAQERAPRIKHFQLVLIPLPHYIFTLYIHKTDQRGRGTEIVIAQAAAVEAITNLISCHPRHSNPDAFLFTFQDGILMSQRYFLSQTKLILGGSGFDISRISGHSFRRGGATALHQSGAQDSMIKTQGRWNSDVFQRYILPSRHSIIHANMLTSSPAI
jgi:integrase